MDCSVTVLDDNICQNCIREINGEAWCIKCLLDKDDEWWISKKPARPYPEDTERWLRFFQEDTMPFEEIVSQGRRREIIPYNVFRHAIDT